MPKITYKDNQGSSKTIEVENGLSVMEGAIQNEISGIDADCGGSMACATCHVYVDDKWFKKIPNAEDAENDMIDMAFEPKKNSRLSCQIIVNEELDGGRSVIQCALPLDRNLKKEKNRHKVFLMQYYSTLQFLKWTFDGNFKAGKNWKVLSPKYKEGVFSPNLDMDFEEFYGIQIEL